MLNSKKEKEIVDIFYTTLFKKYKNLDFDKLSKEELKKYSGEIIDMRVDGTDEEHLDLIKKEILKKVKVTKKDEIFLDKMLGKLWLNSGPAMKH